LTPHAEAIAALTAKGYRTTGFNLAFRCMLFCHWWAEGRPLDCEAIARAITAGAGAVPIGLILGLKTGDVLREWAEFDTIIGGGIKSIRVIPDAWIVTCPKPGHMLMTAVEVIHTNHLTDAKRDTYEDLRWHATEAAEFALELMAA
jgi:hypothetical protein